MEELELRDKLRNIKVLVMDVDGTLTDSKVYYSRNGEEMKCFSIRDGMGIGLLKSGGIDVAIITSENSPIVIARAAKLKIDNVVLGSRNKKADLESLAQRMQIGIDKMAYIGDDVNDVFAMKSVCLAVCPSDSVKEVLEAADYICKNEGGRGAVRELCDMILEAQGKPVTLPESW